MTRRRIATLALAAVLSFSLTGCFGLGEQNDGSEDPVDALVDVAENATEVARTLGDIDWGKSVRAVVRDAKTGEQLAEITDQAQISEVFSPLSQVNGMAPTPDAPKEYVVELWEPRPSSWARRRTTWTSTRAWRSSPTRAPTWSPSPWCPSTSQSTSRARAAWPTPSATWCARPPRSVQQRAEPPVKRHDLATEVALVRGSVGHGHASTSRGLSSGRGSRCS